MVDDKEMAARAMGCLAVVNAIKEGRVVTLEMCRLAAGDDDNDGDTCLHLYMALQGHITAMGYAWDVARTLLCRAPVDGSHWFRRIEVVGQGQLIEILIGGARERAELGGEARAIVAAALGDWARRVEVVLAPRREDMA